MPAVWKKRCLIVAGLFAGWFLHWYFSYTPPTADDYWRWEVPRPKPSGSAYKDVRSRGY